MQTKVKVMLLGVITALALVLPLAAQDVSQNIGGLSSNTNTATATLFKADADNFITVDRYSRVSFDKGFAFVSGGVYNAGTTPKGKLNVGYATTLGSLYLGAWYQGNIVEVTKPDSQTEKTTVTSNYDNERNILTDTETKTEYGTSWVNSANQFQLLIGVANQGIKVGFYESLAQNKQAGNATRPTTVIDYKDGHKDYFNAVDEYKQDKGYLRPYLGWGTDIAVSDSLKLRPYVDFGVEIYKEELLDKYSNYTKINGKKQDTDTTFGAGHSKGYVAPQATVGAKIDIPTDSGANTTTILEYAVDVRLYKNSAEATGFSDDAIKGTVTWDKDAKVKQVTKAFDGSTTITDIKLNYDEQKYAKHTITPQWMVTGSPASGFNLGFKTTAPVAITANSSKQYSEQHSLSNFTSKYESKDTNKSSTEITRTNGEQSTTTATNFKWNLMVGTQYKLIPDRFTINAGITATPIDLTHTVKRTAGNNVKSVTTTTEKDGDGNVLDNGKTVTPNNAIADSVAVTDTWAGFAGGVSGGFTFNFTPKAALDLAVQSQGQNFRLNVTDVHVLLSLKY